MQTSQHTTPPDFAALLQPAVHHQSPAAVLADPELEPHEKRSILSSWASDFYAVESMPWLREIPGLNKAIELGDIIAALRILDDDDDPPPRGGMAMRPPARAQSASRHMLNSCRRGKSFLSKLRLERA